MPLNALPAFRRGFFLLAVFAALLPTVAARAATLGVGDKAPPLTVGRFVKGKPIWRLPPRRVSVVEFWATWCGPCRESIPHLTDMAKKYRNVTFVGVSVWEQDQKLVAPFVKEMGAKMDYRVALDRVPAGTDGNGGAMAKTWMTAAGQDGIPTAFVIGKNGKIAWIGHPMELEEPLSQIAAGKWDAVAAVAKAKKEQAEQAQMTALQTEMEQASQSGDPKKLQAVLDKAIAKNPHLEEGPIGFVKFSLLRQTADAPIALAYGKRLVESRYKNDADALNNLGWAIVDPAAKIKPDAPYIALALQAAKRADLLAKGKNGGVADTLAVALHLSGDDMGAILAETRAIQLAGPNGAGVAELKGHLEMFRKGGAKAEE